MRKKKQKGNPILRTLATMKLARSLDCTFEEDDRTLNSMDKAI